MKKIVLFLVGLIALMAVQTQAQSLNKIITDAQLEQPVLVGHVDRTGLLKGEFSHYFNSQYETYKVTEKQVKKITPKMENIKVTIVLGTWCMDTKIQLPRFMKIMDALAFPPEKISMIALDSRKEALVIDMSPYSIERVPTFIFYRDGVEIGRIVESPRKSLEKDILKIVR